uniref:Uncharacterized protein n=1 Tax=Meloidogyne javanica TaxID=6303 RepID=A0A915MXV7_MELJA
MMTDQVHNYNPLTQQVSPQPTYQQLLNQVHNPAWLKQNLLTYFPAHETVHPAPHSTTQPLDKGKNMVEDPLIKERSKQLLIRGTHNNYGEASDIHNESQNPHVFTRDDATDAQLKNILAMDRLMRGSGQSLLEDVVSPYQTKQGESSNKSQQGPSNNPHDNPLNTNSNPSQHFNHYIQTPSILYRPHSTRYRHTMVHNFHQLIGDNKQKSGESSDNDTSATDSDNM